ncbi:N-acetylmuramoyl-L-alanine amidase [Streptomyces fuscigenes]|uniref:N-acetylmuramoyl-L-alanine amidase n=1 Tax=Streptomyces fuscigenes TaxID=1528880 RepID=UPI001F492B59|nr:peptidoglycan recognition family protein [Streptomyces fuscigenes]MCF3961577.1 N-acetylmuramoyl-L-alanine amidase [Streptomyces fuscigenes]
MGRTTPAARGGKGATPGRRAVLIGGGLALLGGAIALGEELSRSGPAGPTRPRTPGGSDFADARWVAASTANYRVADRPVDFAVEMVVIHVTQADYATTVRLFEDPRHEAASHYVVRQNGQVTQMIRELDVAFHAGNRWYNNHSVGIEHEGFVTRPQDFTDAMYAQSARLTADVCHRYRIPVDRRHIIGHVEVPGTDHTDPGRYWDWPRYMKLVGEAMGSAGRTRV